MSQQKQTDGFKALERHFSLMWLAGHSAYDMAQEFTIQAQRRGMHVNQAKVLRTMIDKHAEWNKKAASVTWP